MNTTIDSNDYPPGTLDANGCIATPQNHPTEYIWFTKHAEDMTTPIEAVVVSMPVECVGQDWRNFVVETIVGTEEIFARMLAPSVRTTSNRTESR